MITATAVTLDLCVEHNVERIVFASSSMVYGDFTSDAPIETARTDPLTLYGSYKLQGEKMCQIWQREKGLEYTILRPSALYGTRDMIVRVISKLAEAALTTGELRVQGPDNKLDFSWVDDVASAFATAATHKNCANEIFNCTRGRGRTIMEAAELVQARLGGKIVTLPHDDFYPNRDTLTSDKLKNSTNWNPQMDIDTGIPKYLDWLLAQTYTKRLPRYESI
jgi:UDP-glucose 4-epimerase